MELLTTFLLNTNSSRLLRQEEDGTITVVDDKGDKIVVDTPLFKLTGDEEEIRKSIEVTLGTVFDAALKRGEFATSPQS